MALSKSPFLKGSNKTNLEEDEGKTLIGTSLELVELVGPNGF